MKNSNLEQIGLYLKSKGNLKQSVFQKTLSVFEELKEVIESHSSKLNETCKDDLFDIEYKENGKFEAELTFAGDSLIFNMHTNVFNFTDDFFNLKKTFKRFSGAKTMMISSPLRSVDFINYENFKVLSVGPRNEGELFQIRSLGFQWKNIYGFFF